MAVKITIIFIIKSVVIDQIFKINSFVNLPEGKLFS
jgi:hypothetical protein